MKKSRIIKVLKYGAIVLFILSLVSTASICQQDWAFGYAFDTDTFLFVTAWSAILCLLMYGLGELIEIQYNNGLLLKEVINKDNKE